MGAQSVEVASVQCHRRRIRQLGQAPVEQQLQAGMLARRVARIRFQDQRDGSEIIARRIGEGRAHVEQELESRGVEGLCRAHHRTRFRLRPPIGKFPRERHVPLQTRPIEGMVQIGGSGGVECAHHVRPSEVGGVRHRGAPVAVRPEDMGITQLGVCGHQGQDPVDAAVANGVGKLAGPLETRPVVEAVAAREQLPGPGIGRGASQRVQIRVRRQVTVAHVSAPQTQKDRDTQVGESRQPEDCRQQRRPAHGVGGDRRQQQNSPAQRHEHRDHLPVAFA